MLWADEEMMSCIGREEEKQFKQIVEKTKLVFESVCRIAWTINNYINMLELLEFPVTEPTAIIQKHCSLQRHCGAVVDTKQ